MQPEIDQQAVVARWRLDLPALAAATHEVDADDAIEFCFRQGWSDGLPVVPPTAERVQAMLDAAGLAPDELLGLVPLKQRRVTAEKLAINAVMAGCVPAYMPIAVAAVRALTDQRFGLAAAESSTGGGAPLLIVNGPGARLVGLNAGLNAFGPGVRANATIGRAIRLLLLNVTGGRPGIEDRSTLGHPGKYSYCLAENEAASPWEPLHVSRGCPPDSTAVTVYQAGGHLLAENYWSEDARGIFATFADLIASTARYRPDRVQYTLVICPEHAETIRRDGWSRRDAQEYLFEQSARSLGDLRRRGRMPAEPAAGPDGERWCFFASPDDLLLMVAGGEAGRKSIAIPSWSGLAQGQAVTVDAAECAECTL